MNVRNRFILSILPVQYSIQAKKSTEQTECLFCTVFTVRIPIAQTNPSYTEAPAPARPPGSHTAPLRRGSLRTVSYTHLVQCIYGSKIKGRKLARRYGRADGRRDEL